MTAGHEDGRASVFEPLLKHCSSLSSTTVLGAIVSARKQNCTLNTSGDRAGLNLLFSLVAQVGSLGTKTKIL